MTAVTKAQQFLVPNATPSGRHYSNTRVNGMPSAMLAIPAPGRYFFNCAGILKPGLLNMGIMTQPHGAAATIAYTIADCDLVLKDPDSVPWDVQPVVANQDIVSSGNTVPSVIRIDAPAKMIVFVAAC